MCPKRMGHVSNASEYVQKTFLGVFLVVFLMGICIGCKPFSHVVNNLGSNCAVLAANHAATMELTVNLWNI